MLRAPGLYGSLVWLALIHHAEAAVNKKNNHRQQVKIAIGMLLENTAGVAPAIQWLSMDQKKDKPKDEWAESMLRVAQHRDAEAFSVIFSHFGPKIKAYGMSLNSMHTSPEMADELVQEVMIKVWEKAKYFKPEKANVSTWVFAIARNCRIDYLRKMKRITSPLTADDLWPVFEEPEPENLTDLQKSGQQIEKIVDNLPAEQVAILREVYIEGKTHAEVSKQTGLPLGTVKSRLRLAMEKLRVNLTADQNPVAEPTRTTTN